MDVWYALPALACPLGMGAMMWLMMRSGSHGARPDARSSDDIVELRREIEQLRAKEEQIAEPASPSAR